MKTDSIGLMNRVKANPFLAALVLALVGSLILIGVIVYKLFTGAERDPTYLQLASDLRASSYQLTSLSRDATAGDEEAFGKLQGVIATMDRSWQQLRASDPQSRSVLAEQITAFDSVWQRVRANAQIINQNKDAIVFVHEVANRL